MSSEKYTWLKSIQNGSIGEARTKSFLIDRFWILERSVDVDGADFIIQAKPANHEILSNMLPRYGRIQAKFIQDYNTPIKLKRDYVVDLDNTPRDDFFLIIHTGYENLQEIYLLSAKDIIQKSYIRGNNLIIKSVTELPNTIISDKKLALDRVENSIKCVSFLRNRTYIFSNVDHVKAEFDNMLPEFKENIEYGFGTISELFKEKKEKAFEYILEIEELHEQLKNFVECVDPIEAALIAQTIQFQYGHKYDIYDENLYYGGKRQLDEVTKLKTDGALDNYLNGRERVRKSVEAYLNANINTIIKDTVHTINIVYNNENLYFEDTDIEHSLSYNISAPPTEFVNCKQGNVTMSYRIGFSMEKVFHGDNWISLMEKIIDLKYYKH